MPKLCQHANCRVRASIGHFCKTHRTLRVEDDRCSHGCETGLYKGYCKDCYMEKFPNDPLSIQMRYKTKETAVHEFINSRFDGFQKDGKIIINDVLLCVNVSNGPAIVDKKYISISFNTDKYKCGKTGEIVNPMLYRRLPLLEDEINRQIEIIVNRRWTQKQDVELPEFIKLDYHL